MTLTLPAILLLQLVWATQQPLPGAYCIVGTILWAWLVTASDADPFVCRGYTMILAVLVWPIVLASLCAGYLLDVRNQAACNQVTDDENEPPNRSMYG